MHHDDFLLPLFEVISSLVEKDEFELDPDLVDLLPPYDLLLPALLDWARSPAATNEYYYPAFEIMLRQALQDLLIDLRQGTAGADEWQGVLNDELGNAIEKDEPLIVELLSQTMANFDFVLPEPLIEKLYTWQQRHFDPAEEAEPDDGLFEETLRDELIPHMLDEAQAESSNELYEFLRPQLHYMPVMVLQQILPALLTSDVAVMRGAALLCLLHSRAAVRDVTLQALNQSAALNGIDARGRDRLIMLRNWLPTAQREQIDPVIQRLRKRNLVPVPQPKTNLKLWASAMDGAGASGLAAVETRDGRYRFSAAILKEEIGIVDCWQSPWTRKKEVDEVLKMFRQNMPSFLPVDRNFLEVLVPHFLASNRDSGQLPEPMLLEWLEVLGKGLWQPNSLDAHQWLSNHSAELEGLDVVAAFDRCQRWFEREQDGLRWFENPADMTAQIERAVTEGTPALEDLAYTLLEPYRDKWFNRCVQLSIWAQSSNSNRKPKWQDFALLAQAIEADAPMNSLPVLPFVAEDSIRAGLSMMEAYQDNDDYSSDDDLFDLFGKPTQPH